MYRNKIKQIIGFCSLLAVFVGVNACGDTEQVHERGSGIYFYEDSLYYSFGEKAANYLEHTVAVPIKLMGAKHSESRNFLVKLVTDKTTAIAGKHYTKLVESYTLEADSVNAIVPITLLRKDLGNEATYQITLEMIPNEEFPEAVGQSMMTKVVFTNQLDEPNWWQFCRGYVGQFHPKKYQKFIEFHGKALENRYDSYGKRELYYLSIFKKVKEYFDANPEEGVVFPDVVWPV